MPAPQSSRLRVLGTSLAVWAMVLVLHVAASYSDMARRGTPTSLGALLAAYGIAYLPWVVYTTALFVVVERLRHRLSDRGVVARLFLGSLVLFLLPEVAWQVAAVMWRSAADPWAGFGSALRRWPAELWLLDLALMTGSFVVVLAIVMEREGRASRERQQAAEAERLTLRLELEQQRLRSLRGQLEPHFLFNALSAIAGLVRSNDQRVAIDAIGQLSAQLRHAVAASQQDWSTIGEELEFVRGYLALQALRYPDRLDTQCEASGDVAAIVCPPLIIQPLVENAIRHDLECHHERSKIVVAVASSASGATITVRNTMHPGAPANPGLGLGLRAVRDRLALLYGPVAYLEAGPIDGEFVVHLFLPATPAHES